MVRAAVHFDGRAREPQAVAFKMCGLADDVATASGALALTTSRWSPRISTGRLPG